MRRTIDVYKLGTKTRCIKFVCGHVTLTSPNRTQLALAEYYVMMTFSSKTCVCGQAAAAPP
jgi:hypothetical protein